MVGTILNYVAQNLNLVVCEKIGKSPGSNLVWCAPLFDDDGCLVEIQQPGVIVQLVGLASEPIRRVDLAHPNLGHGKGISGPAPMSVTFLLTSVGPPEYYIQRLDLLSLAMRYLQTHPEWNRGNMPGLLEEIHHLNFEDQHPNYAQQAHLWEMMGVHFLPSVLYKMRISFSETANLNSDMPPINKM